MFSSLPSASKIYQNSVKPRQKSASSAKKRRKKVHSSSNQHVSASDDSVVSLVSCDKDVGENRIHSCEEENSSSDVSLYSIETCKTNSRRTNVVSNRDKQANFLSQIKEMHIRNLLDLESEQNEMSPKFLKENEQHNLFESNIDESSEIRDSAVIEEKIGEEFEAVPSPEIILADSNLQDVPCDHESNEDIKFAPVGKDDSSEMTFEEVEASIEHEYSKECLEKAAQISENTDENPQDFESNVSLQSSKSQESENQNNHESPLSDTHDIASKETGSQSEYITHFDICHENSNNVNNFACQENNDTSTVTNSEPHLDIILTDHDINDNCISDDNNINDSEENIEFWTNAGSNEQNVDVSIMKKNSRLIKDCTEISMRTRSPEQSELSCTESVSCESKDLHQEILDSEKSFSDPTDKSENYILSSQKSEDGFNLKSSSYISQSASNLLCKDSQTTASCRCASLPEGLHLSKKLVDKDSQSAILTVLDKATHTADLECEDSSEESLPEKDFSKEESQNKNHEDPLAKNSISSSSGSDDKGSLWNVLPPLAMVKARTRSYVFGSKGPTGSLLGSDELNRLFPDNLVTVFVGTWNMNGHDPPQSIDDFLLPLAIDTLPDIYAIGVQESMQSREGRFEWEVLLQATLGPSHVLFNSTSLGVLHLCIFLRRDLIWFCSEPEEATVATRPGTMVKTKGAVAVCFMCFGTSFLFVNSHLTAHEQKLKERLSDYEKIISSLELPRAIPSKNFSHCKDVTSRFDCVFWCGDLNFRVMHDRPSVLSFVEEKVRSARHSCSFLVKRDQLHKAMEEGRAFHGFKESTIHFIPSYKFDVGTSTFTSSKLRVPSYTDRILYRSKEKSSVSCLHYNAVPDISTSDHKPVYAVFKVSLRPGRDNVPLAAGMFKRDVYLEAIKRRSKFLEVRRNHGQSAICSVM